MATAFYREHQPIVPSTVIEWCPECNGSGREYSDWGPSPRESRCSYCDGMGRWEINAREDDE